MTQQCAIVTASKSSAPARHRSSSVEDQHRSNSHHHHHHHHKKHFETVSAGTGESPDVRTPPLWSEWLQNQDVGPESEIWVPDLQPCLKQKTEPLLHSVSSQSCMLQLAQC